MVPIFIPMPETRTILRLNPETSTLASTSLCPEREEGQSGSNGKNRTIMTLWTLSKSGRQLQRGEPPGKGAESGMKRVQEEEGSERKTEVGGQTHQQGLPIREGLI